MTTRTVKPARVIPWNAMTWAQRDEHMRVMHGRDDHSDEGTFRWGSIAHAMSHESWAILRPIQVPHTHDKDPR